ncbi:MAG: polysaccharide deacetylase family protein [Synergistaceae bacterium]|nr:polysaccharide deacetylase family protein [Synergistaceae bacterium]
MELGEHLLAQEERLRLAMRILALKIYADTLRAYREGVPKLLDAFDELSITGSFFFGMGREGSGSVVSRVFGEGQEIVASAPDILRDASRRGQDCGIYGWNPKEWETRLDKLKDTTLEADTKRAIEYFARKTGSHPSGFSAPGFRVNYMSLRVEDEAHFKYCSDTFGFYPFKPRISWKVFNTPQIPSTLPPLEVVLQRASESEARSRLKELDGSIEVGLNVLPVNAAAVINPQIFGPFHEFLLRSAREGVRFVSLSAVAGKVDISSLPPCEVTDARVFGMSQGVALQTLE